VSEFSGFSLALDDAAVRLVDRLVNYVKAGPGAINCKPRKLSSGLYFLKVKTPDNESATKA